MMGKCVGLLAGGQVFIGGMDWIRSSDWRSIRLVGSSAVSRWTGHDLPVREP